MNRGRRSYTFAVLLSGRITDASSFSDILNGLGGVRYGSIKRLTTS